MSVLSISTQFSQSADKQITEQASVNILCYEAQFGGW